MSKETGLNGDINDCRPKEIKQTSKPKSWEFTKKLINGDSIGSMNLIKLYIESSKTRTLLTAAKKFEQVSSQEMWKKGSSRESRSQKEYASASREFDEE